MVSSRYHTCRMPGVLPSNSSRRGLNHDNDMVCGKSDIARTSEQLDELPTDVLVNPKDNLLKTSTPRITPDGQVQLRSQHADIRNSRPEWPCHSCCFRTTGPCVKFVLSSHKCHKLTWASLQMDHILIHSYQFTKGLGGRHCDSQTTKMTVSSSHNMRIRMPPFRLIITL